MSITVVIYLSDNSGQQFDIPNGKTTTTSQYLQLMIATLKLPDARAKKCFSLWLKSPLLDVQLKPHHIPFKMVQQWHTLIERYSMGTDYEKTHDEPALIFRRNAFLTKEEESKITNEAILKLLLMEAKFNIQQSIYPCDAEDIEQLGALICLNAEDKEKHGMEEVVKENLQTLVPSHLNKVKRTFLNRQESMEEKVLKCVMKVSKEESVNCTLEFMKICWQLPYYGSVVFSGFVERAHNHSLASWFSSSTQIAVRVAINTSGVWVIDCEKKHVLIGLLYDEFNWDTTEPERDAGSEEEVLMPSLFLEFDDDKTKTNRLLQIMSKQAPMMNSMIETCIVMIREKEQIEQAQNLAGPSDESNGVNRALTGPSTRGSTRVRPLFERQDSVTNSRPERLNLTLLSDSGESSGSNPSSPTDISHQDKHAQKHSAVHKKSLFKRLGSKPKIMTNPEERELL